MYIFVPILYYFSTIILPKSGSCHDMLTVSGCKILTSWLTLLSLHKQMISFQQYTGVGVPFKPGQNADQLTLTFSIICYSFSLLILCCCLFRDTQHITLEYMTDRGMV